MVLAHGPQLHLAARAGLAREVAARVEAAAGRRIGGIGRRARDGRRQRALAADLRERAQQPLRVRVLRHAEDGRRSGPLSTMRAGVHHRHAVAGLGDHAEVVRDQQQRQAEIAAQLLEQREHLRLRHDVERGRRLVGDHDLGIAGQGQRDHHALAHAARELVRVLVARGRR